MSPDPEQSTGPPALPAVLLPPADELERSQARSPMVLGLALLLERVAARRNDDASNDDAYLVLWASEAGLVETSPEGLVVTPKGTRFITDRLDAFADIVDVARMVGALTLGARARRQRPNAHEHVVDQCTVPLLTVLYAGDTAVPVQELARLVSESSGNLVAAAGAVERDFHLVLPYVGSLMDSLAFVGLVDWRERRSIPARSRGATRLDGTVALTAAGVETTRRWLIESGRDAPIIEAMTEASASRLLASLVDDLPSTFERRAEAWLAARSEEQAVAELVDAIRTIHDPGLRAVAAAMLTEAGPHAAEPAVRQLAQEPGTRAFAAVWLVEHEYEDAHGLYREADFDFFLEVLAVQLVGNPDDSFVDTFALVGDHTAQIAMIDRIARNQSEDGLLVLGGVAMLHPSRAVARAALRAVRQMRAGGPELGD